MFRAVIKDLGLELQFLEWRMPLLLPYRVRSVRILPLALGDHAGQQVRVLPQ
jgi:hypothetical protein